MRRCFGCRRYAGWFIRAPKRCAIVNKRVYPYAKDLILVKDLKLFFMFISMSSSSVHHMFLFFSLVCHPMFVFSFFFFTSLSMSFLFLPPLLLPPLPPLGYFPTLLSIMTMVCHFHREESPFSRRKKGLLLKMSEKQKPREWLVTF